MLKKIVLGILGALITTILLISGYLFFVYTNAEKELQKTHIEIDTSRIVNTDTEEVKDEVDPIQQTEPFSILLLGVDTGRGNRSSKWEGNSDTMMVVTVNPLTKKTTITSLQRDMIVTLAGSEDNPMNNVRTKLNAAYQNGGTKMAIMTVQEALDIKIDKYLQINMQGLVDLVDAVGGIEVTNNFDFPIQISSQEPEYTATIEPGTHLINGEQALVYARMRYDDPNGDYGRQLRQQEVIKKVVEKIVSVNSIANYKKILNAVTKNMQTDIEFSLATFPKLLGYKDALNEIESIQIIGESIDMGDGISYQIPREHTVLDIQNKIKEQLGLQKKAELWSTLLTVEDIYGSSVLRYEEGYIPPTSVEIPNPEIETVVDYEEVIFEDYEPAESETESSLENTTETEE